MIKKLRLKFICINMVLVTVMLAAILCLQYQSTSASLEEASLSALRAASKEQRDEKKPGGNKERTQPCFTLWTGQDGQVQLTGNAFLEQTDQQTLQQIYDLAAESHREYGVLEDYSLRFLRKGKEGREGVYYAFTDIVSERQTLADMAKNCMFIGVSGFFAFLIISVCLARWAVGPVEKAWQQQRQFVADASHELKTPLTVILTNAEMLRAAEYGEEEKQGFSEHIYTMALQMRGLVESLLDLARVDSRLSQVPMQKLDYSALTENAVLPFEPLYFEQGLTLESRITPGIRVEGSETHLRQVVEVLLDNGRKYSAPGGCVQVVLEMQGRGHCCLKVSSPGITMTAQECRDIFKRFYRLDKARSMNQSYGLGLAIAQQIVEDHHGRIWAESKAGINTFFVSLPL